MVVVVCECFGVLSGGFVDKDAGIFIRLAKQKNTYFRELFLQFNPNFIYSFCFFMLRI